MAAAVPDGEVYQAVHDLVARHAGGPAAALRAARQAIGEPARAGARAQGGNGREDRAGRDLARYEGSTAFWLVSPEGDQVLRRLGDAMSADDRMPDRLGPYRLLDRIGEGGMGVVYLARDAGQRTVAVKVLRSGVAAEANALQRLAREVETMRRVRSPYVAEVVGADLTGELPYIATRYVPGRTLDQVVTLQGPLLAEALAAVHAAGVVHRDLKPGNVMMLRGSPVVIDFGIAQAPDATRLTMTGMFMGTPGYLAPEVIEGQPSSEASDVHAWGATVAFAATGRPPFGTGSYETIFYKIVNGQPDLAGVPPALLPLLAAAMARDPAHRPPAVQLSALAAVLDPASLVPPPAHGQQAAVTVPASTAAGGPAGAGPAAATRADPGPSGQPPGPVIGAGAPAAAGGPGALPGQPGGVVPGGGVPGGLAQRVPGGGAPVGDLTGSGMPGGYADAHAPAGYPPGGHAAGGYGAVGPGAGGYGAGGYGAGGYGADGYGAGGFGAPAGYAPNGHGRGDYGDLLPPVDYREPPLPGNGQVPWPATGGPGFASGASASPRGHALLAASSMVVLICLGVLLPVAGTASALALIALLRAGEGVRTAAIRRSVRGARLSHPLVAALSFPWFLVRSLLGLLIWFPAAAATGALVAGVTMISVHADRLPHAIAYGAGALVGFYGLGPGSARPRHQLSHLYARITRTRIAQATALIAVMALAAGAVTAAVSWPPLYSPVQPPAGFAHLGYAQHGLTGPAHGRGGVLPGWLGSR
jgi:hypothetical protein